VTVATYATVVALSLVALIASGWALQKLVRDRGSSSTSPGRMRARAIANAERKSFRTDVAIGVVLFVIYVCAVAADRAPHHHHHDDASIGN
jgi:hypothetical protein